MRLHLPNSNTPVEGLARDILDVFERRRVPPAVGMTALVEVMVVSISMIPKAGRREAVAKICEAIKDNIDVVTRSGL